MADVIGFPHGPRPGDYLPCDTELSVEVELEPAHVNPLPREAIMKEGINLIAGDRHIQHGDAHLNLTNIGILQDAFTRIENMDCPIKIRAAMRMTLVKIARTQSNWTNLDNYVDGGSYLGGLAGEFAFLESEKV